MTAFSASWFPRCLLASMLATVVACEDTVEPDAGTLRDATAQDAAVPDASADAGPADSGVPLDAGQTECGDGVVEGDEVCDPGQDGCCASDCTGPLAADTVCRAAAGACDVAEACDGAAVTCPADQLAPSTEICRAAAGACDVAEACDGASVDCPADLVADSTITCRAAAGACDVAEACDGASVDCPADLVASSTVTCRAAAGACDLAEACDGASVDCPTDAFEASTVACRPSNGPCDLAEACDGASAACPTDAFAASTVTCRPGNGPCDIAEACDGASAACPADLVASSTVTCRAAAGACDAAETCDGVVTTCPADQLAQLGTPCRPIAHDCDVPETCDGLTLDCPVDSLAPDATPCLTCPMVTASCGGCYGGVCLDAQELCADILAHGMSVGDGIYTIAPDPVGTSTTGVRTVPAYCDMTTNGGGWTLIYKKSPLMPGNPGAMFTGTPTRAQDLSVLGRFPSPDYVSDFHVGAWAAFTEVRVEILTGTVATKFIDFDAIGSTPTSWFAADRHTASSWTDLPAAPNWEGTVQGQFFSIDPGGGRKFYVNRTWGGCPADRGWLMISSADFCPWERRTTQPNEILYALGATECLFNDVTQVGYGDAFIIWAR